MTSDAGVVVVVSGRVQGVRFRAWTRDRATELGLTGSAVNLPDGRVEVRAEGAEASVRALVAALDGPTTPGRTSDVSVTWVRAQASEHGFRIG